MPAEHVALPAPTDREKSQMYIQRYVEHFPAAGEIVIFDRLNATELDQIVKIQLDRVVSRLGLQGAKRAFLTAKALPVESPTLCDLFEAIEAGNFPELAQFYQQEVIAPAHELIRRMLQRGIDRGEFAPIDMTYGVHFPPDDPKALTSLLFGFLRGADAWRSLLRWYPPACVARAAARALASVSSSSRLIPLVQSPSRLSNGPASAVVSGLALSSEPEKITSPARSCNEQLEFRVRIEAPFLSERGPGSAQVGLHRKWDLIRYALKKRSGNPIC